MRPARGGASARQHVQELTVPRKPDPQVSRQHGVEDGRVGSRERHEGLAGAPGPGPGEWRYGGHRGTPSSGSGVKERIVPFCTVRLDW